MRTGFSKVCITPPLGSPIVGYYNARFVKGVIDDLYVRAMAFDDGQNQAVVISADLCYLSKNQCDVYRKVIADFCNLDIKAVFICCQHTHTGPLVGKDFASDTHSDPAYEARLESCFRDAAKYALLDLKESKFFGAQTEAKGISFVRRFRMKDGSVSTNPGVDHPGIDHALAEPDETLKLIKIVREDADDIVVVSFGTHCDTVGGEYISADYPGYVCAMLEKALPGTKCIFMLASQGDVNHVNVHPTEGERALTFIDFDDVPRGLAHTKHMANIVAGAALSVYAIAEPIHTDKIAFNTALATLPSYQQNELLEEARKIKYYYDNNKCDELPYKGMELTTVVAEALRIVELENGPESFTYDLFAIKLGDLVFAGIPGEPFTEIGKRISDASPFKNTILCCLTNGGETYFPTTKAYAEGGYEARTSRLAPGGDDIIVNGMVGLLHSL